MVDYTDGAEGFIKWAEERAYVSIIPFEGKLPVWVPISDLPDTPHPGTGRSYKEFWEWQKGIVRECIVMEDGEFFYTLIVFCWPRGEAKSFLACYIMLWKFFCFPQQKIVLGANSKQQVKFVHYDVMRDIIFNSPPLLNQIGTKNVKKSELTITSKGKVQSKLAPITSFSGIVSNITGYTFSEFWLMKNESYFSQLDTSMRNIPNAFGIIDSTVSDKNHRLYKLWESSIKKKTRRLYFSYRSAPNADYREYKHPRQTQEQLDDYKTRLLFNEFEALMKNVWEAGGGTAFTEDVIMASRYLGVSKQVNTHAELLRNCQRIIKLRADQGTMAEKGFDKRVVELDLQIQNVFDGMWPLTSCLTLTDASGMPKMATVQELEALGNIYDTDWAVLTGMDRADPMKIRTRARTILVALAKGLPGSRSSNIVRPDQDQKAPRYLYVLLCLIDVDDHSIEAIKEHLLTISMEFDGVDTFGSERWGSTDMVKWCDDQEIRTEIYYPSYANQRQMFTELYVAFQHGRFKAAPIAVPGSKSDDILEEELQIFRHDSRKKLFGSPEKENPNGIQDDAVYALGATIFGGRMVGVEEFRERRGRTFFGSFFPDRTMIGKY